MAKLSTACSRSLRTLSVFAFIDCVYFIATDLSFLVLFFIPFILFEFLFIIRLSSYPHIKNAPSYSDDEKQLRSVGQEVMQMSLYRLKHFFGGVIQHRVAVEFLERGVIS